MGTIKTRQAKIDFMKNAIDSYFKKYPNGQIDAQKLIAEFVVSEGSTYRTGFEILRSLYETKYFKMSEGIITR